MLRRNVFLTLLTIVFFSFSNVYSQDTKSKTPKKISKGVMNGLAIRLPKPAYPAAAMAVKASGTVNVQVTIDIEGKVESARAISGHPLLRRSAVEAAQKSEFKPTFLQGEPVRVSGIIVYNFVGTRNWQTIGTDLGFAEIKGLRNSVGLPSGFLDEQKQLNDLKESSFEDQQNQLPNIVSLIKAKLNEKDLWLFEYGVAKAKVLDSLSKKDDSLILSNLETFKALANNLPNDSVGYLAKRAETLAEFSKKEKLTEEDRQIIWQYIK